MTIPELRAAGRRAEAAEACRRTRRSWPCTASSRCRSACLVFAVIGLALGLQQARGGKLAAFVPGIGVVFVYYILEYQGRQMAKGQLVPPWLAVWGPEHRPR